MQVKEFQSWRSCKIAIFIVGKIMAKTYAQIQDEIAALQKKAEELKQTEMNGVIDRIKLAIQHYDITPDQLFDGAVRQVKETSIKYADDNGNRWSGRGPRPRWLRDALAAGSTIETFECEPGSPRAIAPAQKPPKFRRPPSTVLYADGSGNSWTGRGPMPRWLREAAGTKNNIAQFLKT
ncbi:MAG: hypothetical protein EOO81_07915 [Oxalobacteraceae bacterium]|nr:MAG: hypothetical protein EOO81_07915 [Oxalobacteraceae bacterium]